MNTYTLQKSKRKDKRFVLSMGENMKHHFGSKTGKTYIDCRTDKERNAFLARHKGDKNFNNKHSGIYYSRHLLWGENKDLNKNIKKLENKLKAKIINKI